MESQRLGERQGFPHIAGPPLTDRVMPALDMSPLARWLVHGGVGRPGEDGSIGRPEAPIGFRLLTGGLRHRPRPAETFRSFRPTKLPGRPLPRPAARSRLPGGERRLPDRPDGDPVQPRPSPQTDPLRIGPQNRLLRRLRIPPLGLQDPIGPTGLAVILLVPVPILSVLDDVPTPASTAPGSPGLRNPGTPPREDSLHTRRSPHPLPITRYSSLHHFVTPSLLSWMAGGYGSTS